MQAPFPYFGGKSSIASIVWNVLKQPKHYIEPFFGSGAVLLARPNYSQDDHTETVCDKDGFLANVWRSIKFSPDETAKWCDWPVNHADLMARKAELIRNEQRLFDNLIADPRWHDPIMAGYWIWAASCWTGNGLTRPRAMPHINNSGMGVHKKANQNQIYGLFDKLSDRLRRVRVACGDWSRVCGGNWQDKMGSVGLFFDPPYSVENRAKVYRQESFTVAQDVQKWCLERGKLKKYKIVLAGYYEEHENLLNEGWTYHKWLAQGGYANVGNGKQSKINKDKEALFFSPNCSKATQLKLF